MTCLPAKSASETDFPCASLSVKAGAAFPSWMVAMARLTDGWEGACQPDASRIACCSSPEPARASRGRLEEIDPAEWARVLAVNLTGPFNTVKAALPHLLAARGTIVNVASSAAMRGQAYAAHYAASKAGLVNFTRSIALEFASRGLR